MLCTDIKWYQYGVQIDLDPNEYRETGRRPKPPDLSFLFWDLVGFVIVIAAFKLIGFL